jgi:hypothetical protein
LFWIITQRVVVISYRRFGTTYRFRLKGSRIPPECWSLIMGPIGCPESSERNYHYSLRNTSKPEEHSSHLFRDGSLQSRIVDLCLYLAVHSYFFQIALQCQCCKNTPTSIRNQLKLLPHNIINYLQFTYL